MAWKLPNPKYLQPIWLRWIDATEDASATGHKDDPASFDGPGLAVATEQGYFVRKDGKEFVFTRTLYDDGAFTGRGTIPIKWVVDVAPNPCPFDDEARK